jgi:GrpB-like predicted nucleotidyltransferase (UPF0157 family)
MLGYEYRGEQGIPRRHYFVLGEPRRFHLHVNEVNSDEWENLILFRDILIKNKALADAYAALKIDLAQRFSNDRESYLLGKAPFIERGMNMARKASRTSWVTQMIELRLPHPAKNTGFAMTTRIK